MHPLSHAKPVVDQPHRRTGVRSAELKRDSSRLPMQFTVTPSGITWTLLWLALFLIAVNVFFLLIRFSFGFESTYRIANVFDLNHERNIPTYFSSLLILKLCLALRNCHRVQDESEFSILLLGPVGGNISFSLV